MKSEYILVGKLGKAYGIKGWLRVQSFMLQPEDIFSFSGWLVGTKEFAADVALAEELEMDNLVGSKLVKLTFPDQDIPSQATAAVKVDSWRQSGRHWVAKLNNLESPEEAFLWTGRSIWVQKAELPQLGEDEYYWRDFKSALILTEQGDVLGRIDQFMETGSNDVMVVKPCLESVDDRERLIPYLSNVIKDVSLKALKPHVVVDWDVDF